MKKSPSSQAQTTLSSYFSGSSAGRSSKATEKRRAPDIVDLTSDDIQDEPAAKKHKKLPDQSSHAEHDTIYFIPDLSNPLHEGFIPTGEGPSRMKTPPPRDLKHNDKSMQKYRFIASPNAQTSGTDAPETPEEKRAKRARREAFKRKLLEDNSIFSQRTVKSSSKARETILDVDGPENGRAESELEGDDAEECVLPESVISKKFASKAQMHLSKSTTVIGGKKKEKEDIGPSGLPYTPLEQQIRKLKKKYPNTVLMVEVGYKYRFFGEDAKIASKHLSIVAFNDRNFLTAGIPVHRRDIHLKKLLSQGYKVGIIGQMETAALKKVSDNRNAPFERDLTHLYTAATYIEELDSVDDPSVVNPGLAPNLLCVIEGLLGGMGADERVALGIIAVTPSTGDVVWDDFEDGFMRTELETRMAHIRPAELLLPKNKLTNASEKLLRYFTDDRPSTFTNKGRVRVERLAESLSFSEALQELQNFYTQETNSRASENFTTGKLLASLSDLPQRVIIGLAHSLRYLKTFGLAEVLTRTEFFIKFTERQHMLLNANTLANLEVYRNQTDFTAKGSLMWTCDKTKTKFGARLFRHWLGRPLVDVGALQTRVDAIDEILNAKSVRLREFTIRLAELLKGLPDLAKGLSRVQYGKCPPKEFASLVKSFNKIAAAFEVYQSPQDIGFKSDILNDIIFSLPKLKEPMRKILSEFNLTKAIEDKRDELWYDVEKYPNVDDARSAIAMLESELQDQLKQIRKILHKPNAQYTSVAGEECLIEIRKDEKREIPVTWKIVSSTKFLRRYQTPEVQKKLQERAQYQETLEAEANKAYLDYLKQVMDEHYVPLRNVVNKLAIADCLLSLSTVASQADYVKPTFVDDDVLDIKDGRHPMIEALRTDPFVPNDLRLGDGSTRTKIITGPNMGGKSSAVRMVALVALMAQIGSYVPATSVRMGLLDAILTRMGASDDIASGRSTFMIEMSETSDILHTATNRSLVILDELGRGTSTFDGMAIASGVLEYLISEKRCKSLFITHYPLVATAMAKKFPEDVSNVHMGFSEEIESSGKRTITFLYRIVEGLSSGSYGIECARLAGLPEELLESAARRANNMQDVVEGREKIGRSQKAWQIIRRIIEHDNNMDVNELKAKLRNICEYI